MATSPSANTNAPLPQAQVVGLPGSLYGAVFDLDGTLLDTEGISERAIDQAVAAHGARHSKALHKAILGRPSAEWTRMVLDALSLHGAIEPVELARQWERNMHAMMAEVQVLPGALQLLRELHARKVPIALATSSSSHAVAVKRQFHPELFAYFSVIVCGNDPEVTRGKPEPDIFLLAAKRLYEKTRIDDGTAESAKDDAAVVVVPRCVVFEDSVLGVQAGKSANMHTVAIPDPRIYADASEREALYQHADTIITSLEQFSLEQHGCGGSESAIEHLLKPRERSPKPNQRMVAMKTTCVEDSVAFPLAAPRRADPGSRNAVTDPHLKDVYAAWLKDLYEDNSVKVIKSLRRKSSGGGITVGATRSNRGKKKQQQQLAHALQPTEASASKHISQRQGPKLPLLAHVPSREAVASSLEEAHQRRHQMVASEANCASYEYCAPFQPGLAFFKLLVETVIQSSKPISGSSGSKIAAAAAAAKYEISSFPIRVSPTLLRFGSCSSSPSDNRFRVALLFTHETSDSGVQIPSGGSIEDSSSSFVLCVQVYATERQYREQCKALMRLFITHDGSDQQPHTSSSSATVVAVSKHASENHKSNATSVLRTAEDVEVAIDRLWNGTLQPDQYQQQQQQSSGDLDGDCAIQKYIPYKGSALSSSSSSAAASSKAWIARPVYRTKDKASWIWILTDSGSSETTDSGCHDSCQIVKCIAAQSWSSPRMLASICAHFFENLLSVSMTELALDLIQDTDGRWWLLQVKAFQLRRQRPKSSSGAAATNTAPTGLVGHENCVKSAPNRLESIGLNHSLVHKKWRCAGQHCISTGGGTGDNNNSEGSVDANGSPSGYLTKKVLLSCDFYDKYMTQQDMSVMSGFANFSAALSFHLQHQISKRDHNQLYESQPLCSNCVTKYHFIREQWIEATTSTTPALTAAAIKHSGSGNAVMKSRKTRLLPSLQSAASTSSLLPSSSTRSSSFSATMKASYSALAFLSGSQQPTNLCQATTGSDSTSSGLAESRIGNQHNSISKSDRPVYLSEMEKIEEMLTEHDTKFTSSQSKKNQANELEIDHGVASLASFIDAGNDDEARRFSSFLQKRSEANSIEEMWKSISLKSIPLPRSLTTTTGGGGDTRPKVSYNSYSLSNELEKQQQQQQLAGSRSDGSEPNGRKEAGNCGSPPSKKKSDISKADIHTIVISDCKQVFYDEDYRERVVSEGKETLVHRNRSVRLVVVPPSIPQRILSSDSGQKAGGEAEENQELAEMVLRSLFLDLSQSAAARNEKTVASLRKQPAISRESSGCTTMLLVADRSDC